MPWVALSRVGASQDVPSSFRAAYIFEYFAVLTSFRTNFQGSETGLHRKVLDLSSTLLWKLVSKPVFIYQKPVYTRKYSKISRREMAPEHPGMFRPLRGRLSTDFNWRSQQEKAIRRHSSPRPNVFGPRNTKIAEWEKWQALWLHAWVGKLFWKNPSYSLPSVTNLYNAPLHSNSWISFLFPATQLSQSDTRKKGRKNFFPQSDIKCHFLRPEIINVLKTIIKRPS